VTKPLTLNLTMAGPEKDKNGGLHAGFDTSFTIKRSDFGMKYGLGPIGDEVMLTFSFEAVPKQ